ncbi:probable tubulin polyglutamylase TTLL9 [Neodiprion pinetum]|uniref:probable tubulin polyglutamylase TTLL9 n=1 Tax=Neodiprion pinetum TaxID=441929 RepID=UPI0037165892
MMISQHETDMVIRSCAPPPYRVHKKQYKPRNGVAKRIKFRCDFPSTQAKVMLARGWVQVEDGVEDAGDWNLWWCEMNEVRFAIDRKLRWDQKIPHFRNHYELTRKNYLYRNLKRYEKLLIREGKTLEANLCDCMPVTFELPNEYHMLVEEYHRQGGTWIVKPAARSQGKGIFLFQKLKDLVEWKHKESTNQVTGDGGSAEAFVVQKYVDNPYLLAGRKFDLRIYVLVTSFNPLKVWLAREGFARLSGELFSLQKINDSRVHLTNMSIQLKVEPNGNNLERLDKPQIKQGCKWALRRVREYLTARHGGGVMDKLLQRIAGVIMASLQAVKMVIMQGKNSFELYGYDILLDEHLTPWLLEVNASPALAATDSEDYRLKFDLLDDALTILDFEGVLTGSETRVGGFDLLWDGGPVWTNYPGATPSASKAGSKQSFELRRFNIFLGSYNDRIPQLRQLREQLSSKYPVKMTRNLTSNSEIPRV